jgi:hypothetical protein
MLLMPACIGFHMRRPGNLNVPFGDSHVITLVPHRRVPFLGSTPLSPFPCLRQTDGISRRNCTSIREIGWWSIVDIEGACRFNRTPAGNPLFVATLEFIREEPVDPAVIGLIGAPSLVRQPMHEDVPCLRLIRASLDGVPN